MVHLKSALKNRFFSIFELFEIIDQSTYTFVMESLDDTDNITKNIVQEVVRECKKIDTEVDENFCVYYVKLLILDPKWKISPEKKLNREYVQNIITFLINKFRNQNSLDIVTLKSQHLFLLHTKKKDQLISSSHKEIDRILYPLLEDIFAFCSIEANKAYEAKLYRKIAFYIVLRSGMGNPKHLPVIKEVTAALRSVLDESELMNFMDMPPADKIQNIHQFEQLVAGIRLFNRDCDRLTNEIEDLPKLLTQTLENSLSKTQMELMRVMADVNLITTAIESVYKLKEFIEPKTIQLDNELIKIWYELEPVYPETITEDDVTKAVNLLILSRQREIYLRKLLNFLDETDASMRLCFQHFEETLFKLHQTVKYKVAISTNIVYPLFVELAKIWSRIQDETLTLTNFTTICTKFHSFASTENTDKEKLFQMLGDNKILTDAMRLERTMTSRISLKNNKCQVQFPKKTAEIKHLRFLGFCVWYFVETNGGLIPGNPSLGVCIWKNRSYVFASKYAAAAFGSDPDWILMRATNLVREKPELINLLMIHDDIFKLRDISVLVESPVQIISKVSTPVQTELHPIPTLIDPDYVWNIWDYYRQAIKLANITQCKTHSMQTKKSHFRCPIFVQTTEPRDKICQTKTDNYMNVSTPSNFIFGLRGRRDDVQHIIELTRPYDEEYFYTCAAANKDKPPYRKVKSRKCRSFRAEKPRPETNCQFSDGGTMEEEEFGSLEECICITGIEPKTK